MMTLYHGSHVAVTSPLVSVGRRYLDFGQGFYLTSLRRQAEKCASIVASRKGRRAEGVLNVYSFNDTLAAEEGVRFKRFDSYDIEWLDYVVACRGGKDASLEYDVVEGGVANGNPKSVIRLLRANESIFLSSVSLLLGYNGTPLRPQSSKTSVAKIRLLSS